jgi:UDP-N-acetylmuramate--alanine ligase
MSRIFEHKHVHFIAIGGISMSGIAEILIGRGVRVSGSDWNESEQTEQLRKIGATVHIGHDAANIPDETTLIIYNAAISQENPEFAEAIRRRIPLLYRTDALGQVMDEYKYSIAVSACHGKTTTTSMIFEILMKAGGSPSMSLGGVLPSINSNVYVGDGEYFVAEACEYKDGFLKLRPHTAVIMNLELDHLDYFKDYEHILSSYKKFAENIPPHGRLIVNPDIECFAELVSGLECEVISGWNMRSLAYEKGKPRFDIYKNDDRILSLSLTVMGEHNAQNALYAAACCLEFGISHEAVKAALEAFTGTKRRFEYKGIINGITVVDDYSHHPTEVKKALKPAKQAGYNKVWCVFQPHTYTRTKELMDDFATAFDEADEVIIVDIYAAREADNGVHSRDLADKITNKNKRYLSSFDEAKKYLLENCADGDLIITMGAGDIFKLGDMLLG